MVLYGTNVPPSIGSWRSPIDMLSYSKTFSCYQITQILMSLKRCVAQLSLNLAAALNRASSHFFEPAKTQGFLTATWRSLSKECWDTENLEDLGSRKNQIMSNSKQIRHLNTAQNHNKTWQFYIHMQKKVLDSGGGNLRRRLRVQETRTCKSMHCPV